jgi:VanZ family protein
MMGAIFQASSLPLSPNQSIGFPDSVLHSVVFFALGVLTARMVAPDMRTSPSLRHFLLALSIVLGYGLLDEIHQISVPGRQPDWQDLLCDASGGLLGILIYPFLFTGPRK